MQVGFASVWFARGQAFVTRSLIESAASVRRDGARVTVLMPTFNRPELLVEAIASVRAQRFEDWVLWVLNDGGQDVRADVQRAAGDDPRVEYFSLPHRGKAGALNWACSRLATPLVAYLDDDDRWLAGHLELGVLALEREPSCQAAYADVREIRIDPDGQRRHEWIDSWPGVGFADLLLKNLVNHNALIHRASLLAASGPYDERLTVLIDWDMIRRLAWRTRFAHVKEITVEHCLRLAADGKVDTSHLTGRAYRHRIAYWKAVGRILFKPPWSWQP